MDKTNVKYCWICCEPVPDGVYICAKCQKVLNDIPPAEVLTDRAIAEAEEAEARDYADMVTDLRHGG